MHGVHYTHTPHFQNQFATTSSSFFVLWRRACWGANQRAGLLCHNNQEREVGGVRVVWSRVWTRCSVCGVSMSSSSSVRMGVELLEGNGVWLVVIHSLLRERKGGCAKWRHVPTEELKVGSLWVRASQFKVILWHHNSFGGRSLLNRTRLTPSERRF